MCFYDLEMFDLISATFMEGSSIRCIMFHPSGSALLSGSQECLKVWGWEPVLCFDSVDVGYVKAQFAACCWCVCVWCVCVCVVCVCVSGVCLVCVCVWCMYGCLLLLAAVHEALAICAGGATSMTFL